MEEVFLFFNLYSLKTQGEFEIRLATLTEYKVVKLKQLFK